MFHNTSGRALGARTTLGLVVLAMSAVALIALVTLTATTANFAKAPGSCEQDACGASKPSPDDCLINPGHCICAWDNKPDGAHKAVGCAFCRGGECVNKLQGGAPTTDPADCQSGVLDENGARCDSCEAYGCGSNTYAPADTSICNWDTQPEGWFKPAGCTYCSGGKCVNKKVDGELAPGSSEYAPVYECRGGMSRSKDPSWRFGNEHLSPASDFPSRCITCTCPDGATPAPGSDAWQTCCALAMCPLDWTDFYLHFAKSCTDPDPEVCVRVGKVRAHEVLPGHFIDDQCPLEGGATLRTFFSVMNGVGTGKYFN
ncbi:hypothetical protein T492DRAFT_902447 [Pavlovales sp. CCMP2436]|nr:hypothetical protein T492DRAFT_902447 [Pavlovales sp. CCMP2436]